MTMHKVRIHISGVNAFTEEFPGGSAADAKKLAWNRYPNAQRCDWQGVVSSHTVERGGHMVENPRDRQYVQDLAGQGAAVTIPECVQRRAGQVAESADGAGFLLIAFGGIAGLFVIAAAVLAAPVIGAAGTGRIANKATRGRGLKTRIAATILAGVGAFAGTAALQKEYMPEIHETQVEFIQQAQQSIQG